MIRRTGVVFLAFLFAVPAFAQVRFPRPSPKATVMQSVGLTDVTITYSRPSVKGRPIWGALVPYDKVWRTGANEATTINFSDDVWVGGQKLTKGTYSLHTIPGSNQWTIILNSVADQWGSYSYDQAKDVVRFSATPQKGSFAERLTFEFPDVQTDTATVAIRWENVSVPFTIDTKSTEKVVASAKSAINNAWRTSFGAANFAFENKMDALANEWLNDSLKQKETMANLWLKARMQQRAGDKAAAIKTGEMALAKKTPQDSEDFAAEIRKQIDGWKK